MAEIQEQLVDTAEPPRVLLTGATGFVGSHAVEVFVRAGRQFRYGAGIAMGCTIGAFFSSIPSLAINGWVFAGFLGLGAWIGTLLIRRIA